MLRLLFFVIVVSTGLVASLWSRFAALLTYVWFALFRPQEWLWVSIVDLRLSLVLGFMLVVPSLLTGIFPNLTHPLSAGALFMLVLGLIAHPGAVAPDVSLLWIDTFGRLLLVSLLAVTLLNSQRRVVLFLAVLCGSIGFHTAKAGFASALGGGLYFAEGLAGPFVDNNGYALGGAMILPLLLCVWQNVRHGSKIERWAALAYLVAVPLTMLMVIGTKSRAGFLALIAAVLAHIAVQKRRFVPIAVISILATVALPFVPVPEGYFDRMRTIQTYQEVGDTSALSRLHFWKVAVRMAQAKPLGIGLRNYDSAYDRYDFSGGEYGHRRSVHSSHFQVLAEIGFLGALIWILLFCYAFYLCLRLRRFGRKETRLTHEESTFFVTTANSLIVSMVTFLVGGAFIALALNDLTWYSFALIAAIDRLAKAKRRELAQQEAATSDMVRPQPRWASA